MHRIWFNGKGYPDAEAMPPQVRRQYEEALRRRAEAETRVPSDPAEPPHAVRLGAWEGEEYGTLEIHTSREIIVNGKKYSDFAEIPPEDRALVDKMMGKLSDMDDFFEEDGLFESFQLRSPKSGQPMVGSVAESHVRVSPRLSGDSKGRWVKTPVPVWSTGWLVALVLAIVMLLILIF